MKSIKLTLQYDGTNYAGWQAQQNAVTIQELVEKALGTVLQERVRVAGASRTDSGVHALGQVAAFTTSKPVVPEKLMRSLNGILPPDIRVTDIDRVGENFVPRFAKEKTYRYAFACGEVVSPFLNRYAWHIREHLDFDAMTKAAECLVGTHDFSSFVASGGGEKTHVRTILRVAFGRGGFVDTCSNADGLRRLDIVANGFLYKMARNIVGTIVEVGRGKMSAEDVPELLKAKDRTRAGPTAPAHGLCLISIQY